MPTRRRQPSIGIIAAGVRQRGERGISRLKELVLKMEGVQEAEFNYATDRLTVKYDERVVALDEIRTVLRRSAETLGRCSATRRKPRGPAGRGGG